MTTSTQPTWTPYDASACVESFDGEEHDQETIISAWQYLLDTGLVWQLQGWYGRAANELIEAGFITPPTTH
jgi:hypothetical protein